MFDWTRSSTARKMLCRLYRLRGLLRRPDPLATREQEVRAAFYEALWREAAAALGADVTPLGRGVLEIRMGEAWTRVMDIRCPLHDQMALLAAGDKLLTYSLLEAEGLPTPRRLGFRMREFARAADFLEAAGRPCVVKPADGTAGGAGVVTGIRTRSQLAFAAAAAAVEFGPDLLIEEQAAGANYRLLYLDGELLDAVVRRPPQVVGDGQTTIRGLVGRENAARLACKPARVVQPLTIDLDMHNTLAEQGLSPQSIPPAGTAVTLKTVVNQNFGAENASAAHLLCEAVVEAGARAARCVGARFAGVDVITPDPTAPLGRAGGVVLEVNVAPGLHYHYHKKGGDYPVAVRVLERLLGERAGVPCSATVDGLAASR